MIAQNNFVNKTDIRVSDPTRMLHNLGAGSKA